MVNPSYPMTVMNLSSASLLTLSTTTIQMSLAIDLWIDHHQFCKSYLQKNVEFQGNMHKNDPTANTSTTENTTSHNNNDDDTRARPRNKSIMHWSFIENNTLFVSLDIETGGTHCGIVQLSAELFRLMHLRGQKKSTTNHCAIVGHL